MSRNIDVKNIKGLTDPCKDVNCPDNLERIYIVDMGKDGNSLLEKIEDLENLIKSGQARVMECDPNKFLEAAKRGEHFRPVKIGEIVPCTRTFQINFPK